MEWQSPARLSLVEPWQRILFGTFDPVRFYFHCDTGHSILNSMPSLDAYEIVLFNTSSFLTQHFAAPQTERSHLQVMIPIHTV